MPDGTATAHLYRPKVATILSEGYGWGSFRRDVLAALTVAIVALPLSMAIAVASGVSPNRGLYAAIIGGFLVSALGGSRFQIGGPAGAFIVLVAATVARFGVDGLLLTVLLSGAMLTVVGLSRLGALIRYIPHAVTVGFTCGIAVTILASQVKDLAGLTLSDLEPGPLFPKLAVLGTAVPTINGSALTVGIGSAVLIFALQKWRPSWPAMLIAVGVASLAAAFFHLPIETIGSHFGGIPHGLPAPHLPAMTMERVLEVLPMAFSFTLLAGIESLLSAKVADGMTGRKHRYNMELLAQGIANIVSAIFGGISVTGTIARTATNIRAGARSPFSGMMHAIFLLLFMMVAAPLASFIPLSTLAGVLVVVSWNMAEKREFAAMLRNWRTASVLIATFGLTIVEDLTYGIVAGCMLAAVFAVLHRSIPSEGGPSN
jgi:SulP family sulfate permease